MKHLLDIISSWLWKAEIRKLEGEKLAAHLRLQTMHAVYRVLTAHSVCKRRVFSLCFVVNNILSTWNIKPILLLMHLWQLHFQWGKPHYQDAAGPLSRLLNHNELLMVANLSSQINPILQIHTHPHASLLYVLWSLTYSVSVRPQHSKPTDNRWHIKMGISLFIASSCRNPSWNFKDVSSHTFTVNDGQFVTFSISLSSA